MSVLPDKFPTEIDIYWQNWNNSKELLIFRNVCFKLIPKLMWKSRFLSLLKLYALVVMLISNIWTILVSISWQFILLSNTWKYAGTGSKTIPRTEGSTSNASILKMPLILSLFTLFIASFISLITFGWAFYEYYHQAAAIPTYCCSELYSCFVMYA